jgi:hypothetical protein
VSEEGQDDTLIGVLGMDEHRANEVAPAVAWQDASGGPSQFSLLQQRN